MIIGYDEASPGGDYSVTTYYKRAGRVRRILQRLKIDRTTWEYKVIKQVIDK